MTLIQGIGLLGKMAGYRAEAETNSDEPGASGSA